MGNNLEWLQQREARRRTFFDSAKQSYQDQVDTALASLRTYGAEYDDWVITYSVRKGESSARDGRITASCSTNDGECGQGWYQQSKNALAPLLTWRICHIWRFLYSDDNILPVSTDIQAVYTVDDFQDIRTGCIGCGLLPVDNALKYLVKKTEWAWLEPYMQISAITDWLRMPAQRLRKVKASKKADGTYRNRTNAPIGALTMDARKEGLSKFLAMQDEVRELSPDGKGHDIITGDMVKVIKSMWEDDVYPGDWTGNEPAGDEPFEPIIVINGKIVATQPLLPNFGSK